MTIIEASRPSGERHVPDAPAPGKRVLKVDIFEIAIRTVGVLQLMPIFPYLGDGDVVPCLSPTAGRPDLDHFQFFHVNEVDETLICLASQGAGMKTGAVMKLAAKHGVTAFLRNPHDPASFNVNLITIRMKQGDVQEEAFSLSCPKCHQTVFRRDFNVKDGPARKHYPEFYALRYYAEACEEFNSSETNRTCVCGEVLPPFPLHLMGWWLYAENIDIAERGREELETRALESLPDSR